MGNIVSIDLVPSELIFVCTDTGEFEEDSNDVGEDSFTGKEHSFFDSSNAEESSCKHSIKLIWPVPGVPPEIFCAENISCLRESTSVRAAWSSTYDSKQIVVI